MSVEISPVRRARLDLLTHKRGLLAAVGHDLCLGVDELAIELDRGRVQAWFELSSLRVRGAMVRGGLIASTPSQADRRTILDTLRREILDGEHHPRAKLEGELHVHGPSVELVAELSLRGHAQSLVLPIAIGGGATLVLRTELAPSRWGIAPYSALGGALKLEDRVSVELELEVDPALLAAPMAATARWKARP